MKRLAIVGLCLLMAAMARGPSEPFDPKKLPPAPNYHKSEGWAARAPLPSMAERIPEGEQPVPINKRVPDVFFIHPTTYFGAESWNADIHDAKVNRITDRSVLAGQAAAFNKCCRIFVPRYRQMSLGGFVSSDTDAAHAALDIAYQDIRQAFQIYKAFMHHRRQLILAAHSQGTNHLIRLLQDEVLGKPIMKQLVVVYAIGNRIPQAIMDGPLRDLPVCNSPTQTSCLVAWDSFEENANPNDHPPTVGHWDGTAYRQYPAKRNTVCVNPITWKQDAETGPHYSHLGAVWEKPTLRHSRSDGDKAKPLPAPYRQHLSAKCQQGGDVNGLMISNHRNRNLVPPKWMARNGQLHTMDYALFFIDIRQNAYLRTKAYWKNR